MAPRAYNVLDIFVPDGASEGDILVVQIQVGQCHFAQVPEGAIPGSCFEQRFPILDDRPLLDLPIRLAHLHRHV